MPKSITIPKIDLFNDETNEFSEIEPQTIRIEHSLVSLSKWERKWKKPFLSNTPKTDKELRDYIRCMTLTQNVDDRIYDYMPQSTINEIIKYMEDPMTATTVKQNGPKRPNQKIITSEVIYGWMIVLGIPIEFQKWHLNTLLTLIEVVNDLNAPPKKMGTAATMSQNRALNEARRKAFGSKG